MKALISIDDTDNLDSPGTGELASQIARMIRVQNWGETFFITRHQLFVHPDIPYTSHNSAMCFEADIDPECTDMLIADAGKFLLEVSAPGSDPGLCVVLTESLSEPEPLISFGQSAKSVVLTKDDAYELAQRLGIHLSEHGGTGQGVIGALAGAGLRLGGNDGRLKGRISLHGEPKQSSVKALCAHRDVDAVQTLAGDPLPDEEVINLGEKVKTVLIGGRSILLVKPDTSDGEVCWRTCNNQELKCY